MLRAMSTRNGGPYERLGDESSEMESLEWKLNRTTSVPVKLFSPEKKVGDGVSAGTKLGALEENPNLPTKQQAKKSTTSKTSNKFSHPIFSFLDGSRRKKKTTAKPEFSRYLEYLKEGGFGDLGSTKPAVKENVSS